MIRHDALLCSINDRLGGKPGQDFSPLGLDWMQDVVDSIGAEEDVSDFEEDIGL